MIEPKILYTDRLIIRPIEDSDIEYVFKGLSDPLVYEFLTIRYDTLEATKVQMEWYQILASTGKGFWWAICDKKTNQFLGACGFSGYQQEHHKIEGGYWLLPENWGQGILAEAYSEVFNYVFENPEINRIECIVEVENTGSKRLLEKLNFTYEGRSRQAEIKNAEYIDIDIYSKLKSDK
ncbi:GNAT family protein [Soonwooa sp.]|uniref:GNAT family N-acetyltransferase n=1 Tax=Soonwooa sp. TaxID=1938592 RepID=UPI00262C2EFD|nr:GNAT family protein [Soonwooa sp.]